MINSIEKHNLGLFWIEFMHCVGVIVSVFKKIRRFVEFVPEHFLCFRLDKFINPIGKRVRKVWTLITDVLRDFEGSRCERVH